MQSAPENISPVRFAHTPHPLTANRRPLMLYSKYVYPYSPERCSWTRIPLPFYRDAAFLDRLRNPRFERAHQFLILHVVQHLGHGFAVNQLIDGVALELTDTCTAFVSPKRLCIIAQNLLIGPIAEEHGR